MARIDLCVLVCGKIAGVLSQDERGIMSYRYTEEYDGPPLSSSMPISNRTYGQDLVRPYLFGLLPDSEEQRKAIAYEFDCKPNNPVAMLSHIGLDCPGAVQFCSLNKDSIMGAITRAGSYEPITEHEIAERLRAIRTESTDSWVTDGEHWSLGGNQGKFALAMIDGTWCSCKGSAATTHIFKNGVVGMKYEALDEFVCMRGAKHAGIHVASVDYRLFEDEPALIIKRFDRHMVGDNIMRHHQEDACQALSVMPNMKYTSDGGPTACDIQMLLGRMGGNASMSLHAFTDQLFFNYLVGASDAHAKNYSITLEKVDGSTLLPMYDVASSFAYERDDGKPFKLAMSIGGENRFGWVGRGPISRYAGSTDDKLRMLMEDVGLAPDDAIARMASLAEDVPRAMEEAFKEAQGIDGIDELHERMMGKIAENCRITLMIL